MHCVCFRGKMGKLFDIVCVVHFKFFQVAMKERLGSYFLCFDGEHTINGRKVPIQLGGCISGTYSAYSIA